MRLTLAMASPLLARYAFQGSCDSDPRVLQKINEARERLMKKPQNWRGKTQRFLFCSANSCITLPREIETVEAATVCNQPMKMRGPWYDVLEGGPGSGNQCGGDNVIDRGDGYVSFVDLDEPRNIKIYTDVPEASGARILLQGFDENGNRVRTFDSVTNAYVDGEYVGLNNATPQVSTTVFSTLDGIVKPETNGFIRLYAFTAGVTAVPFSDVTSVEAWPNNLPLNPEINIVEDLGSGSYVWAGEVLELSWLTGPAENRDFDIGFGYDGVSLYITMMDQHGGGGSYLPVGGTFTLADGVLNYLSYVDEGTFPNNFRLIINGFPNLAMGEELRLRIRRFVNHPANSTVVLQSTANVSAVDWLIGEGSQTWVIEMQGEQTGSWLDNAQAWRTNGEEVTLVLDGVVFTPYIPLSSTSDGTLELELRFVEGAVLLAQLGITIENFPNYQANSGQNIAFSIERLVTAAVPATPDYLALMAIYHPDETNPSYRRYEIPQLRAGGTCCGGSGAEAEPKKVVVMAKLRYLPVKRGTDFLVIEHLGALKMMLLALNFEEKGDLAAALQYETKAEEILAQEIQNHIGDAATANQGMKVQTDAWAASTIPNLL